MTETCFLPDGATDLPADRDMTLCPFGCGATASHNQSIYLWECQSNSLRLVSEPVGHPIPGDLIQTSTCRTRKELATLRAQLADSQRLMAEAERERDEAIPNRVFEQIIELQRKYSEAKYSFFTRQTANNVLAELAALLAPAAEEVEGAR